MCYSRSVGRFFKVLPSAYQDILLYPVLKFLAFSTIVYGAVKLRNLNTSYLFPRKRYNGRIWCFFVITVSLYLLERITTDIIDLLSTNAKDFIKSKETRFYGFQSRGVRHFFSLVIIQGINLEKLPNAIQCKKFYYSILASFCLPACIKPRQVLFFHLYLFLFIRCFHCMGSLENRKYKNCNRLPYVLEFYKLHLTPIHLHDFGSKGYDYD